MSCMLSLKTVAKKKKEKLDFTYLRRCHSLAEEPTEKKKFSGFTASNLHSDFYSSDSVPLGGGNTVASLEWG